MSRAMARRRGTYLWGSCLKGGAGAEAMVRLRRGRRVWKRRRGESIRREKMCRAAIPGAVPASLSPAVFHPGGGGCPPDVIALPDQRAPKPN